MSFKPLRGHEGKEESLPMGTSVTLTRFSHCKMSSGYLAAGASGDNEAEYIALETKTNSGSAGAAYALVLKIDDSIDFEALCSTTPVQATHVGNDYDFSTAAVVDLGATTDKIFHINKIVNAADKLVEGRFNKPSID